MQGWDLIDLVVAHPHIVFRNILKSGELQTKTRRGAIMRFTKGLRWRRYSVGRVMWSAVYIMKFVSCKLHDVFIVSRSIVIGPFCRFFLFNRFIEVNYWRCVAWSYIC